jgi:hypothetical protein
MRLLSSISCAFITIGMVYLDNPGPINRFANKRAAELHHLLYDKQFDFKSLKLVKSSELESLLPKDRSIIWWLFNLSDIEAQLVRHSLVKSARVNTCDSLAVTNWGCFSVEVDERHPAYAALISDEVWILGQDGGLLFPVPKEQFEKQSLSKILSKYLAREVPADKHLKIIQVAGKAPDLIHARLSYTRRALEIIEESSRLEVSLAKCSQQGEIRARFDGYPFEVIFDYSEDAPKTLADEAKKLATLIAEFGKRAQTIELIDLAYNKLAVVRFTETASNEQNTKDDKTMFTKQSVHSNLITSAKKSKRSH